MNALQDRLAPGSTLGALSQSRQWTMCLLAAVLVAAVPWQTRWGVVPDTSWIITMCERILGGDRLYVDLIETNPPFTAWLFMPPVALAHALNLAPEIVVYVYVYAICLLGLGFAALIAKRAGFAENRTLFSMLPLFLALLVILPGNAFTQREHLGVALLLPLLVLTAWRAEPPQARMPGRWTAMLAGLCAGVLVLVKPYYALVVIAPALYAAWRRRSIWPLLAIEYWVIGLVCVAYAAAVMLLYPEFLSVIYPTLADTYMRMGNMPGLLIAYGPVYLIALLMLHFLRPGLPLSPLVSVFTLASLAATVALIYQAKGWPYHAFPAFSLVLAALLLRTAQIDPSSPGKTMELGRKLLLAAIVAAAAIPFMKTQKPNAELVARLEAAAHQPTVALVGSDIAAGHPLTRLLGGTWISRYCSDWLSESALYLSAVATRDGNKEAAYHYREIADRYIDGKLAELETKRPMMLIIQKNDSVLAEELSRHQDYVRFTQDYRPIAEDETVRVLLRDARVSQAPSPAATSD
ncbi:hypothetical protein [Mesorhizobium sp. B2-7-1]|uniref:hypothetical protein n=1 Tax=Mesorhizobium sp. B2-7-1 TaxID=2589909 RepID=UPI001126FBA0|nr:hypothetical protein [Mesorhizobium sp. B2-7-1]TPJ74362.1 hypothetical protein FJ471_02615 [Mesorhizobium sp. B2-7-1]